MKTSVLIVGSVATEGAFEAILEDEVILHFAQNAEELDFILKTSRPEVLLLDEASLSLGEIQTYSKLLNYAQQSPMKIIALSKEDESHFRVDDVLNFPIRHDEILSKIRVFGELTRAEREIERLKAQSLAEKKRLETLNDYQILDSAKEQIFEDLTLMAQVLCQTAIAGITLVDSERTWFKSIRGLNLEESDRESTFCHYTVVYGEPFVVEDVLKDPRFQEKPFITQNGSLRFYAGIPLVAENGDILGAVCVLDHEPRVLGPEQLNSLKTIAKQVMRHLDWKKYFLKLLDQEKLTSLRTMARGAAHEINNPLAIIQGNLLRLSAEMEREVKDLDAIRGTVKRTEVAIKRISNTVRSLGEFAKEMGLEEYEKVDVKEIITSVLNFNRQRMIDHGVILHLPESAPLILECLKRKIAYVLIQILSNSIDAIVDESDKEIAIDVREEGPMVIISISNKGPQIPKELRNQIFNPFFTTKEVGEGMGMGLASSQGIAESHGGHLRLAQKNGKIIFTLALPKLRQISVTLKENAQ